MSAARSSRRGGWWGVAFVVTLAVSAGMVSLPTSAQSGAQIAGFYRAHAGVILVQQVLGVLSVVFFLLFAVALGASRRRWLLVGTVLVAITELATNVLPVVLALSNPTPDGAYALTVAEDLADAALFASVAVFSIAVGLEAHGQPSRSSVFHPQPSCRGAARTVPGLGGCCLAGGPLLPRLDRFPTAGRWRPAHRPHALGWRADGRRPAGLARVSGSARPPHRRRGGRDWLRTVHR